MGWWLLAGLVLVVGATVITLVWWRLGDTWADAEYKKFGHGGGRSRADTPPTVIQANPKDRSEADLPKPRP